MTREIMKEIRELIAKGYSGREITAMGYAESTVRAVGDRMVLRGELPGITQTIRQELRGADNAEALKQIRRELRERGFKKGSIATVVSELRRKGEFVFEQPQAPPSERGKFACHLCGKRFVSASGLSGHKQWVHRGEAEAVPSTTPYNPAVAQLWEEYREKKARLLKEYNEKLSQLLKQYEEKAAWRKKRDKDEVKRLQAEVEVRDKLLKKLMERLSKQKETGEVNHERR
jgi:hypothetical protein